MFSVANLSIKTQPYLLSCKYVVIDYYRWCVSTATHEGLLAVKKFYSIFEGDATAGSQ